MAAPSFAADNSTAGRWFAEGDENGVHIQVFLDMKPDGSYVKDVRIIDKCDTAGAGKETGKWTYEKGDLATESEMLDGKPVTGSFADIHDLYNVTRIDESHINLYDTETKINWALSLATASTMFPPPRGCSV
jgi:hypothetical protein